MLREALVLAEREVLVNYLRTLLALVWFDKRENISLMSSLTT